MRRSRIAVVAAVLAAGVLAAPGVARAQVGPGQALVRVAHFSPDASYVDIYMVSLNRKQLFPNVFYKSVSDYWAVAAGPFTYEVRAAGAAPESKPVIRVEGNLAAGKAYTVAAVGRRDRLEGLLLRDDMPPSAPGKARVRFLDAAFDLPPVDIALEDGPVLAAGVAFPEPTGYRQLASGRYRVQVRRAGAGAVLVRGTVAVKPGTVTSVALVGGAGRPRELHAFGDARGTRATPAGGISTGAGGAAPSSRATTAPVHLSLAVPLGTGAVLVALVGAAAVRRRPAGAVPAGAGAGAGAVPAGVVAVAVAAAMVLVLGGCAIGPERPPGPRAGAGAPGPDPAPSAPAAPVAPAPTQPTAAAPTPPPPIPLAPAPPAHPRPHGSFDAPGLPPRPSGFEVGALPAQVVAPGPVSAPVRVTIPAIGVGSRLVRLGLDASGGMQVPEDFGRAGWFTGGAVPGQPGPAVIAGHVDSRSGPAVFARLRELRPGDVVQVQRADGVGLTFEVTGSARYPKAGFPIDLVFGPVIGPVLRLITCGGAFDRSSGHYRDNLVVFARLARVTR